MSIIANSNRVILRDNLPTDFDSIIQWNFQGEHLKFDAPWERGHTGLTEEQIKKYKEGEQIEKFKEGFFERIKQEKPTPRGNAIIATIENIPIGTVNRYYQKDNKDAPIIGISITKDEYLNQGLGTEAYKLWLDYQFENSNIHRIGAETWSFNPRAIRIVEKVGFILEGRLRKLREWEGQRLDKLLYGMLRSEWEKL